MSFTTIINGEGDAMRQLEGKQTTKAASKTPPKTSTRSTEQARLVLANGEMGEAARLGLSLVGAGVTAVTFGVLEGMVRKGKAKWWGKLAPQKRGLILMAFVTIAGVFARSRRRAGHVKSACAFEAAAIGAWTLSIVYFTESGLGGTGAKLGALPQQGVGGMDVDELRAIDAQIDDDIQSAARRLRRMAQEQRHDEGEAEDPMGALHYEGDEHEHMEEDEDVGALRYAEWDIDDDDDIFY